MATDPANTEIKPTPYAGLRFKIAIIAVIVSLAPMILVGSIILYQFNAFSHETLHAHLGALVLKHRQNIDAFLFEKLNHISRLSRIYDLDQLRNPAFLKQQLRLLQEEHRFGFVALGLIQENGQEVSYAGPLELQSADYRNSDWFPEAIERDSYIGDLFLDPRGQPHFIVAVKRQWAGRQWLFKATINFATFNALVENVRLGQTGGAFILNRQGDFQTRPPQDDTRLAQQQYVNLFERGEASLFKRQPPDHTPFLFESPPGNPQENEIALINGALHQPTIFSVEKLGVHGRKLIIVAAILKNGEWLLVFQQEFADAFAKLKRTQRTAGLISLLSAIGIIVAAFTVSGIVVKRIVELNFEKEMMSRQVIETGKLASVGELAAGIAHEINNPMAIMVEEAGWLQDLLNDGIDPPNNLEEFTRAVKQIENQGRRCKEITHRLLRFARKTDARGETVQLNDLIMEVVDLLSQKTSLANVAVNVALQADLPAIQASATEMQQVVMNIIHNALDAMENTGGRIQIAGHTDADQLRLSIADTGPGIPESNIGRLFDPFFTTKPVGKGTGLGLSICYGIIHKMGGRIDVESRVGNGTTFHIVLPLRKPAVTRLSD